MIGKTGMNASVERWTLEDVDRLEIASAWNA